MPGKWDFSFNDLEVITIAEVLMKSEGNYQIYTLRTLTDRFIKVANIIKRVRRNTNVNPRRTY